jgi:hypothetical protein
MRAACISVKAYVGRVRVVDITPKTKELIEGKRTGFYIMRLPLFKERK